MKTLMIHEVPSMEIFPRDVGEYTLTFDDGLYSQYYHWKYIKKISVNPIFFIPTSVISLEKKWRFPWDKSFLTAPQAMTVWFARNDNDAYMTVYEIRKIMDEGATIGAHSHLHAHTKYYKLPPTLRRKISSKSCLSVCGEKYICRDTEQMLEWFQRNLGFQPTKYCFPYNHRTEKLEKILRAYGFDEFYGAERTCITTLSQTT